MQSQSNLCENYQELLNSLKDIHPDLDLKLTQPQYDDNIDILRTAYLKLKMEGKSQDEISEQDLKPLDQLTKNDLLQAKISYLTALKARKMEEQETSDADIDRLIIIIQDEIKSYQNNPKKLSKLVESQGTLKELEFIKSVSYALQSIQRQINNLAGAEEVIEEQKDESLDVLMKEWEEKYDPFEDINTQLEEIKGDIERFKLRKNTKKLQDEEEKLALLLRIIQARERQKGPDIFSDQELEILMEELGLNNVEDARGDLEDNERKRARFLKNPQKLQEMDLLIQKIKRCIQLFELKGEINPMDDDIKIFERELNELCQEEEVKTQEDAELQLQEEENNLANMTNTRAISYQRLVSRIKNLKRIIELFQKIRSRNLGQEQDQEQDDEFINYPPDAIEIPEVDPKNCFQDQAIARAQNAMEIDKLMPECFQMSINKVIYLSTLLLYDEEDKKEILGGLNQDQMKEQLAQNLGSLINLYTMEGYENLDVKNLIYEVQSNGNSKSELEAIIKNISTAQIKHRFFNFKEFKQLLSLNEEKSKQLKDKDVTLLLGSTGCGKSTTVHYLCGSKMKKTENGDMIHIQASLVINYDLQKVKCSPLAKSETRYVTPMQINLAQIGQRYDQIITLVDTPGSQDTESYEVDISNGLGIIKAVQQAKGVRLVILFSYLKLGARGEEIKKLISFYAGMLKNLEKHLPAFSFFFTHVPLDISITNLRAILEDGYNQLTELEKQNKNLKILFKDIVEKACDAEEGKSNQVHILRPLDGKPIKIHRSILQSSPIGDRNSFLERIDDKGQFQVNEQFKIHAEAIISAIKRSDGKYAIYLLEDLLYFQKVFDQDQVYKDNIKIIALEVIKYGQQLFKQGMQGLEKAFSVSEDNNLSKKDFQKFELCFVQAKSAIDPFCQAIKKFLKNQNSSNEKLQSYEYIANLRELVEDSLENMLVNISDLANPLWNRYINKYLLTLEYFSSSKAMSDQDGFLQFLDQSIIGKLQKVFQRAIDDLTDKTRHILLNMTLTNCTLIEENNKSPIELISENLAQLVTAFNQIEDQSFNKSLDQSVKLIQGSIKAKCNQIRDSELRDILQVVQQLKHAQQSIVSEEEKKFYQEEFFFEVTQRHVENITNFFLMHQKLSSTLELIPGINSQFLEEQERDTIDLQKQLLQFYFENEEKLKSVIKKKSNKHRNIKKAYDQINSLRRVPFIEKDTRIGYNDVITLLESLVQQKKEIVQSLIPDIDQLIQVKGQKAGSSLSQLKEGLMTIMELKDLLPQSKEFFLMIVDDLMSKLNQLADNLKSEAQQQQLSFDEIKQIKKLEEIYQQLNDISQIASIIKSEPISNIELGDIKQRIVELLTQIEVFLNKKNDPEKQKAEGSEKYDVILINKNQCSNLKKMFEFLKTMNKESPLINDLGLMQQSLNLETNFIKFIQKNAEFQLAQFEINLQIIRQKCGITGSSKIEEEINVIEFQVNNAAKNICDRLKTFKEIKTYYNELYRHFDGDMEIEEKILKSLSDFLKVLKEKMKNLHEISPPQFNANISILTNLFIIDSTINFKEIFGMSFEQIHTEAFKIFIQNQGQSEQEADIALEQGQYQWFNQIMSNETEIEKLNKRSSIKSIEKKLEEHIKKLDERVQRNLKETMINTQVKTLLNKNEDVQTQENDSLIEKLNEDVLLIIELLQHVKKEFITRENLQKLQSTLVKFYTDFNNKSDMIILSSSIMIKDQKYYEAYKIIKNTLIMLNHISLNEKNEEQQENVIKQVKDAQTKIKELNSQLQSLHDQISEEAKFFKECSHPNDFKSMNVELVCSELEKIIKDNDYRDINIKLHYDNIKKSINDTFEKRFLILEEIVVQKDNVSVSFDNMKEIEDIEKSLIFVGEKIKKEKKLAERIEKIKKDVKQQIDSISKNLKDILSNKDIENNILKLDFKNLSYQLQHRLNNLEQEYKDLVDQRCFKMVEFIEERLKPGQLSEVFEKCLGKFYDIQSSFIQPHLQFKTIKRIQDLEQNILAIFTELQTVLKSQLQQFGISGNQAKIQIKSQYLQQSNFLATFQSFMKIPNEFQQKLNPKFQEQIISIANIGHQNLSKIKYQFDNNVKNNQFLEANENYKLIKENICAIQCLQDPSYFRVCNQINDPEISQKVEYFKQYHYQLLYTQILAKSFQNNLLIAQDSIKAMKNSKKSDLKILKNSILVLQTFQKYSFSSIDTSQVQSILDQLNDIIKNKMQSLSVWQIEQFIKDKIEFNNVEDLKMDLENLKNLSNHFEKEAIQKHFEAISKKMREIGKGISETTKYKIGVYPVDTTHLNQICYSLYQLQGLIELSNENDREIFSEYQEGIQISARNKFSQHPTAIQYLTDSLDKTQYGKQILLQNQVLIRFIAIQKMTSITDQQLEQLIMGISGIELTKPQSDSKDTKKIFKDFRSFEYQFNIILNDVFQKSQSRDQLVSTLLSQTIDKRSKDIPLDLLPKQLAIIFSIYALQKDIQVSQYSSLQNFKNSIFQPNPTQIIALLRMFGIGYSETFSQLKSNIIEMEQKEENTIVISIAASIFGLYGYQVSCACSNQFICMRELFKFQDLFKILNVQNFIKYKTLDEICQNEIIFKNGIQNDTDLTIQNAYMIKLQKKEDQKDQSYQSYSAPQSIRKILLIYNTENLFSQKFQYKLFAPTLQVQNQELSGLFKLALESNLADGIFFTMWNKVFGDNKLSSFNNKFHELLKRAIQKEITNPNPINIIDDQNSSTISFQNVDIQSQKLVLIIGKFLLSEMPLKFTHIMGLSSNFLNKDDQNQNDILKKYQILDLTQIPPFLNTHISRGLPRQKLIFSNEYEQFQYIQVHINQTLEQKNVSILVIFDSQKKIESFQNQIGEKDNEYHHIQLTQKGKNMVTQFLKAGELMAQVNLIKRKDVVGVDFKILNAKFDREQGLFVITTFDYNSQNKLQNIEGIAGQIIQILSEEQIQKDNLQNMRPYTQLESQDIKQKHIQSVDLREYVFQNITKKSDNQKDTELQNFLIELNQLPTLEMNQIQKDIDEDDFSIVIMIDFTKKIKSDVVDTLYKKIKDLILLQNGWNRYFKNPIQQKRIRFCFYLLGTTQQGYYNIQAQNEEDLKIVQQLKDQLHQQELKFTFSFGSSLQHVHDTEKKAKFIVLIGSQDPYIDHLSYLKDDLPPIYSFFMSVSEKSPNIYQKINEICKIGKSEVINFKKVDYLVNTIEQYILLAYDQQYCNDMIIIDKFGNSPIKQLMSTKKRN